MSERTRVVPVWGLAPLLLLLSACQTLPPRVPAVAGAEPPEQVFAARQVRIAGIGAWTLRGRGAVSADGRGWSGGLHWRQQGPLMDLRFIAPLGAGTLRLTGTDEAMRVRGSDGTDFITADPAAHLSATIGAPLPVSALRWWVLGVPDPGSGGHEVELDIAGRPTIMQQAGWRVEYDRYVELDTVQLASRVTAVNGDLRMRFMIEDWDAGEGDDR